MFEFLGKSKKHRKMFERAYAEYSLGRIDISINILNQIVQEKTKDYRVFNLRALSFVMKSEYPQALRDFITSIDLEPNIKNEAYLGREGIVSLLHSGEIHCNIPQLMNYFSTENIVSLIRETSLETSFFAPQLILEVRDRMKERLQIFAIEYTLMRLSLPYNIDKKVVENPTEGINTIQSNELIRELNNTLVNLQLNSTWANFGPLQSNQEKILVTKYSSDKRIADIREVYESPWSKDIKKGHEKPTFLTNYATFSHLKKTFKALINLREYVYFHNSFPERDENNEYVDFNDKEKLVLNEWHLALLNYVDYLSVCYNSPFVVNLRINKYIY